ncbi:MAG: L,D-transpeptidase family protein [Oscillospiraceae bacterium]
MKKTNRLAIPLFLLICALLFCFPAKAAFEDFSDGAGHWSEAYLRRAVEDGLLNGYDDGLLHPDDAISCPQALAIICRVLRPSDSIDPASLGLNGDEWYSAYAAMAAAMDIDFESSHLQTPSMTRAEAFTLLADAFQLVPAEQELSCLERFKDGSQLSGSEAAAMAALVSHGYVEGYDGCLSPSGRVSRAEFLTVLYRIAGDLASVTELTSVPDHGVVISGSGYMIGKSFTAPLWFDCKTENVKLWNVSAKTVIFRSQASSISVLGSSSIDRLVIAGGSSDPLSLSPTGQCSVGTVVIGDNAPESISIGGNVSRVEITGSGCSVSISTNIQELIISGSGCSVTLAPGFSAGSVRLMQESSGNTVTLRAGISEAVLDGENNALRTEGSIRTLTLDGSGCTVSGSGAAEKLILNSARSSCEIEYRELEDNIDYGIGEAVITLTAPETLPAGQVLNVTAAVENPFSRHCTAVWSVDGVTVKEEAVDVGPEPVSLYLCHKYEYTKDMAGTSSIQLTLKYTFPDGSTGTASGSVTVAIENYDESHYHVSAAEALALVTSGYTGDYTTQWALEHDYTDAVKTAWINAKGYSSTSSYIIWVSKTYQRVNIFEGSAGNWELIHTFLCGTGAPGHGTPEGVYTIFSRSSRGWITSTYCVRPVVNFKTGSGYAFHSRLYDPSHEYLTDASIGFPVSHGCVRMYDEDVQWIYDNVPTGTTVVVY